MSTIIRKSRPGVRDGEVLDKTRHRETPNYLNTPQEIPFIERQRPGKGYSHFMRTNDLRRFFDIIPDWPLFATGLRAILLATGTGETCLGWHSPGVIAICAWPKAMDQIWETEFVDQVADTLDRLQVPREKVSPGFYRCKFNEQSVRGFQLMDVFLHELAHHYDRITTKSKVESARGEKFAVRFAQAYSNGLWDAYFREFGS